MKDADFSGKIRERMARKLAEGGFVDADIFVELVDYGRRIYRAGMDFAEWAARMARDLGERGHFG